MMKNNKKFKIFTSIIAILVIINAYMLLRNNDVIEKSYYIGDIQRAISDTHTEELEKEGILSANQNTFVAVDIQDIEEIYVKRSESVMATQELATLKSDAVEQQVENLEIELSAYETELRELESILSYLEDRGEDSSPSAATDSTSVQNNNLWNLDLTLELGIDQSTPTAEGEAIISRHIAETERQIDILSNSIDSLETDRMLVSPVDGVVGEIIQNSDTITFVIYPEEKSVIVYVDEEQWRKIEVDQAAQIFVRPDEETALYLEEGEEYFIDGTVIEKHQIPAEQSIWYEDMQKNKKINPDKTLYEVKIEPFDALDAYPFGEKAQVTIITEEVFSSFMVHEDWIVEYEVEDIGNTHIYTLGYDGRTRLTPVDVAFTKKGIIEEPIEEDLDELVEEPTEEEEVLDESAEETEETMKIHTVDIPKKDDKEEEVEEELYNVTVFTGLIDEDTVLLDGTPRNIYAPTFRPYPLKKFEWEAVGPITWQEVVQFMIQP